MALPKLTPVQLQQFRDHFRAEAGEPLRVGALADKKSTRAVTSAYHNASGQAALLRDDVLNLQRAARRPLLTSSAGNVVDAVNNWGIADLMINKWSRAFEMHLLTGHLRAARYCLKRVADFTGRADARRALYHQIFDLFSPSEFTNDETHLFDESILSPRPCARMLALGAFMRGDYSVAQRVLDRIVLGAKDYAQLLEFARGLNSDDYSLHCLSGAAVLVYTRAASLNDSLNQENLTSTVPYKHRSLRATYLKAPLFERDVILDRLIRVTDKAQIAEVIKNIIDEFHAENTEQSDLIRNAIWSVLDRLTSFRAWRQLVGEEIANEAEGQAAQLGYKYTFDEDEIKTLKSVLGPWLVDEPSK